MSDEKPTKEEAAAPSEEAETAENHSAALAGLSDQLLRLQAEFDNYKKRTAKEKEQLAHASESRMMLRMLPIYEEISLAEKEAQKIPDEAVKKGILLVLSKLRQSFAKDGLQEMKLAGEKFDPFRHEAAMHEHSAAPESTIVRVIQKGYFFRGEVLRHAIVSVSAGRMARQEKEPGTPAKEDGKQANGGKQEEQAKKEGEQ